MERKFNCGCNVLEEKPTHIENNYMEVQQFGNELIFEVYDYRHNESGSHNNTKMSIKIKYCPFCGKKL